MLRRAYEHRSRLVEIRGDWAPRIADTEHLLLGLLSEGEGVAIAVLTSLHVQVDNLRPALLARVAQQA